MSSAPVMRHTAEQHRPVSALQGKTTTAGSDTSLRPYRAGRLVPIVRSGVAAQAFCQAVTAARVVAVFERCCYLRCGALFICIGEPAIGNGPLNLIAELPRGDHLRDLSLRVGQNAVLSDRGISVDNTLELTLAECVMWVPPAWPSPPPHLQLRQISARLDQLLATGSPIGPFARPVCCTAPPGSRTQLAHTAHSCMSKLEFWLRAAVGGVPAHPASSDAVAGLIGLGQGLTPSGDDFLIGALAALDALRECRAHALLAQAIAAAPSGLTSPLSECFLRTAAAGHVSEPLHRGISLLLLGSPHQAVAGMRGIGHSSGWDMLAGAACALRSVVGSASG